MGTAQMGNAAFGARRRTRDSILVLLLGAVLGTSVLYAAPSRAAFPGPNGKLALGVQTSSSGLPQFEILVQNPDGTGRISLSASTGARDYEPTWSPDGTKVAFSADVGSQRQIGVMDANGSNRRMLTGGAGQADRGWQPGWAPTGDKIVFTKPSLPGIFVMNADGTGASTLLADGTNGEPVWSPDGQKIAFARNDGTVTNVHVVNPDGSGVQQLTSVTSGHVDSPDWSPNSTRLVVACPNGSGSGICVMNRDGTGGLTPVTDGTQDFIPVWSPQGDQIAFARYASSSQDVFVMNADGSNAHSVYGAALSFPKGVSWQRTPSATSTSSPSTTSAPVTTSTIPSTTTTTLAPPPAGASRPLVVRGGTWYLRNSQTTGNATSVFGYGDPDRQAGHR